MAILLCCDVGHCGLRTICVDREFHPYVHIIHFAWAGWLTTMTTAVSVHGSTASVVCELADCQLDMAVSAPNLDVLNFSAQKDQCSVFHANQTTATSISRMLHNHLHCIMPYNSYQDAGRRWWLSRSVSLMAMDAMFPEQHCVLGISSPIRSHSDCARNGRAFVSYLNITPTVIRPITGEICWWNMPNILIAIFTLHELCKSLIVYTLREL